MSWPHLVDLSRLPMPGTDGPSQVRFTPDGSGITYLQAEAGSLLQSLWRHDLASGERRQLLAPPPRSGAESELSRHEQLERERRRVVALGVTDYDWLTAGDQPVLLVPMGGSAMVATGDGADSRLHPLSGVSGADVIVGSPGRNVGGLRSRRRRLGGAD